MGSRKINGNKKKSINEEELIMARNFYDSKARNM